MKEAWWRGSCPCDHREPPRHREAGSKYCCNYWSLTGSSLSFELPPNSVLLLPFLLIRNKLLLLLILLWCRLRLISREVYKEKPCGNASWEPGEKLISGPIRLCFPGKISKQKVVGVACCTSFSAGAHRAGSPPGRRPSRRGVGTHSSWHSLGRSSHLTSGTFFALQL